MTGVASITTARYHTDTVPPSGACRQSADTISYEQEIRPGLTRNLSGRLRQPVTDNPARSSPIAVLRQFSFFMKNARPAAPAPARGEPGDALKATRHGGPIIINSMHGHTNHAERG